MLLFALCWLTLPTVFAPLERWLVGAACVLPRTIASWWGQPAHASAPVAADRALRERAADLEARTRYADVSGARSVFPGSYEPVRCAVRQVVMDQSRRAGGGVPAELRLDRTYAELAGASDLVTKGVALIGYLPTPGNGVAADDQPEDFARVVLLGHRSSPPVGAELELEDGGRLRLVVRGAASIDPAPLRADLWDDPYRAARLDHGGQAVRTMEFAGDRDVPAGLLLGHTRIWGYSGSDNEPPLTIGVFVAPPVDPRALSRVVVWKSVVDAAALPAPRAARHLPAVVRELPGAAHGRYLLAANGRVPDGAAVVQRGRFLGTARGLALGGGLLQSFAASRHAWCVVLLPDEPGARPRELEGTVESRDGDRVLLRVRGDTFSGTQEPLVPGTLFTGSNGPFCPSGLAIGEARPHGEARDLLAVEVPPMTGPIAVEIVVDGGAP
ncbi:MAG: hypothetical protein JNL08_11275 [Planctomycetes bacterium]|nr:hypothetical protein [Planctomycetota bacterium]